MPRTTSPTDQPRSLVGTAAADERSPETTVDDPYRGRVKGDSMTNQHPRPTDEEHDGQPAPETQPDPHPDQTPQGRTDEEQDDADAAAQDEDEREQADASSEDDA